MTAAEFFDPSIPSDDPRPGYCNQDLHRMTPENTYIRPGSGGTQCRACKRASKRGSGPPRPARVKFVIEVTRNQFEIRDLISYNGVGPTGQYEDNKHTWTVICPVKNMMSIIESIVTASQSKSILRSLL